MHFGAWKGKGIPKAEMEKPWIESPHLGFWLVFFPTFGKGDCMNHTCGSDLGRSDIFILTGYT